ncbi:hypothetical protein SIO70_02900 [Chitinophaga sancti]|uniref:hypothetical protein n=1 Tax=Chitinophaga sancti TaxID=1004 RepID=UPI002A763843|nr:hypothetical protein [Chitinophaga sancti]WPQ63806.1 hypothetical protein SIO70_02900 [Chitinophaga sancti]
MSVDELLNHYKKLLEVYSDCVIGMEKILVKVKQEQPDIRSVSYKVLNSRMFTEDEYLTNNTYLGYCFKEKSAIMPYLIPFVAAYEKSTDEEKQEFQNRKPTGPYQGYLDELWIEKIPLLNFLEKQLLNQEYRKNRLIIPFPPKRKTATKQLEKYREDKKTYEEEKDSIERCRNEINERISLFKKYFKEEF